MTAGADDPAGPQRTAWWRRPVWMTRQSWVSLTAALGFLCCVVLLSFVPVPYVTWSPGVTEDTLGAAPDGTPAVTVRGTPSYPTSGRLDLTTVSVTTVDGKVSLVQALLAWLRPGHDALDRELYYPPGTTQQQNQEENAELMAESQLAATVAAARAAGREVTSRPVVRAVVVGGPAQPGLQPGDYVLAVDGNPVGTAQEVSDALAAALATDPGEISWLVLRDGSEQTVRTGTRSGTTPYDRVGAEIVDGQDPGFRVDFGIPSDIGGSSAGLVFSLAIYDLITPGTLLDGRHIAGTGTIDSDGRVGSIGGIRSKIAGAEAAGATVFLVPADNCEDIAGVETSVRLVRVATLDDAVAALRALDEPDPQLASC